MSGVSDNKDVYWLLSSQAEKRPDAPFFHWAPFSGQHKTYSYGAFLAEARSLAVGFKARGLKAGDKVLLHANNSPEFLLTWHACAMLGLVVVTTNPRSTIKELAYFVGHSQPRAIITQPEFLVLFEECSDGLAFFACTSTNSGEEADLDGFEGTTFEDLLGDGTTYEHTPVDPLSPLSVQYTSGTTSLPKGVVWTHANAIWGGQTCAAHNQLRDDDVAVVFTPLCHTNAMSWAHFPALWSGSAFVLQPKFSASRFWDVALRYGATWGNCIPFAVQALATQPVPADHTIRFWVVGAANVGPVEQLFRIPFVGAWGMTETIAHGTYTPIQLPSPPISMGMPVPELELKVVNGEGGECAAGETGDLKVRGVRGVQLFFEYLNDEEATAKSFDEDGWFDTGDRVTPIEDGHLRFADRAKDMLKVGAENVAASEIEAVISAVDRVIETAVVAKSHPMRTEVPVAYVRAANASEELRSTIMAACEENLSDFKRPVAVEFMDEFPRAELNKVAKQKLRELAEKLEV